jgi:hypothetical protein
MTRESKNYAQSMSSRLPDWKGGFRLLRGIVTRLVGKRHLNRNDGERWKMRSED